MLAPTERLKEHRLSMNLILPETAKLIENFTKLIFDVCVFVNLYKEKGHISKLV